jgi:N-methylhydantoinase A
VSGASVGIDVGGTFTDLVSIDAEGGTSSAKVLSTPADQSAAVLEALRAAGAAPGSIARIVHGTTVATNTLLERDGARTIFCATAGFTDLLQLRRQDRASLYDPARHHPPPLAERGRCVGVRERIAPGEVLLPLEGAEALRVADEVAALGPEAVAVALLHSYADPSHERQLARALAARLPEVEIILSSDVLPEIREYERAATTVAEAYLRPRIASYLRSLGERVSALGHPAPAVMTSSGGMLPALEASRSAAALALSGPAGGVVGAAYIAGLAGFPDALSLDIGGTSADAGVILQGEPLTGRGGDVAGVPIALPRVLVETVSAGGGSLGWIDDGGALRTGPRSAGAVPGPAAFGRGGMAPTVTDAHVVLGHIAARGMSGGVRLDPAAAQRAMATLAQALGRSSEDVAAAMIASADASMARALRRVSVERGIDPRRCALVAFGGGGPLHGCTLADQLGVRAVIVPPHAGVLSALGLAIAPERREALLSVMRSAHTLDAPQLAALFHEVAARVPSGEVRHWWIRARYAGQGHELEIGLSPGENGQAAAACFASAHLARFGFTLERDVEIVSIRYAAGGRPVEVRLERRGAVTREDSREALIDSGAPIDRTIAGPAIVALPDATMRVAEGWTGRAMPIGGWLLERRP